MKKILFLALLSMYFFSCGPTKKSVDKAKDDGKLKFTFVQLNDVYEIAPLGGGKHGGMARVAHVVDSLRKLNRNTYLIMAGDFLNPSLLGTLKYEGERIHGRQMVEVMNAMDFDFATFGNHEFDIGREDLQKRMNESEFEWISANCFEQLEDGPRSFHFFTPEGDAIPVPETYSLKMKDNDGTQIEVGLFSVTLDSNPQDFVYYSDVLLESRSACNSLEMQQVDVILGMTHVTIDEDVMIAKTLPQIRFIMGGHEHSNMLVDSGNARIAKADANAETIYIHNFEYDKSNDKLDIQSKLFPITNKLKEKPEVKAIVDKWEAILMKQVLEVTDAPLEVIYYADPPLDGTDDMNRSSQTNLGEIVTNAMMVSFDKPVDAALVNGGSFRLDDMLHGEVTQLDIFRVLPFGGGVLRVEIKGDLLIDVLEFGASKVGNGAYLHRHNLSKDKEGTWLLKGAPILKDEVYTVAFSDFLLKGLDIPILKPDNEGVISVTEPRPDEPAHDIRKAIILYLKSLNQ